jgi:hypothetical protein
MFEINFFNKQQSNRDTIMLFHLKFDNRKVNKLPDTNSDHVRLLVLTNYRLKIVCEIFFQSPKKGGIL